MEVKQKKNLINLHLHLHDNPPPSPVRPSVQMAPVAIRKTVAIESQPAPLIKSLGGKMSLLERKERGKIIGEKRGDREEGRRGRRGGAEDEGIKSVLCVVSETHFLVRG